MLALLDVSSLAPRIRTDLDAVEALNLARTLLRRALPRNTPSTIIDTDLRIYGGFFAHDGSQTDHYTFLRKALPRVQGLSDGLRVRPNLAGSLACRPSARIIGTYRDGRQRMVDQMLSQDARYLAPRYDALTIIADDEDYFPAVLALATEHRGPISWIRQRALGRNDQHLQGTTVTTAFYPEWTP